MSVVIKQSAYVLVNVPDFVRYGSKPMRDLQDRPAVLTDIVRSLWSFDQTVAYAPNQVFIGNKSPEDLWNIPQPWHGNLVAQSDRKGPFGEIVRELEFYAWLKIADEFKLLSLESAFLDRIRQAAEQHALISSEDLQKLGNGVSAEQNQKVIEEESALPLYHEGRVIGCVRRAHDNDDALKAEVLLENLLAKASGALVLQHLLDKAATKAEEVDFILECSETAIGDRYNRGGGSLAKAVGEMCHCRNATGHDVRAFCASPVYAIIEAAALIEAGIHRKVVVVGGGCLAKVGMKYAAHVKNNMPILEDVLGGIAFLVTGDDGESPTIRLDCIGKHDIGAGSSQQAIMTSLMVKPLARIGMKSIDIDKFATELQNPEITMPAGSGNTPYTNYKIMASLAALNHEINRTEIEDFVKMRGMPGFAPTQGHVPAAVPYLGHAIAAMKKGAIKRAMFIAKGSLFLGRMSQLSDGMSFLLEANAGRRKQ